MTSIATVRSAVATLSRVESLSSGPRSSEPGPPFFDPDRLRLVRRRAPRRVGRSPSRAVATPRLPHRPRVSCSLSSAGLLPSGGATDLGESYPVPGRHLLIECQFAAAVSRGADGAMAIAGLGTPRRPWGAGARRRCGPLRGTESLGRQLGHAHGAALASRSWSVAGAERSSRQTICRSGNGPARLRLVRDGTVGAHGLERAKARATRS